LFVVSTLIVDAESARRPNPSGIFHPPCWFGKAPRPAASVAMLEEALTLVCASMLPNAVLPTMYIDRYVTRPLVRTADRKGKAPGRHDEWPTLLFPHAAAALSKRSDTSRSTAAAAALTAIAAAAVKVAQIALDDSEEDDPRVGRVVCSSERRPLVSHVRVNQSRGCICFLVQSVVVFVGRPSPWRPPPARRSPAGLYKLNAVER
jgi:hypothetical protein